MAKIMTIANVNRIVFVLPNDTTFSQIKSRPCPFNVLISKNSAKLVIFDLSSSLMHLFFAYLFRLCDDFGLQPGFSKCRAIYTFLL